MRVRILSGHDAAAAVDAFVRGEPNRRRSAGSPKATLGRARDELDGLSKQGWARAMPRHFVALYARLHEDVYGVFPAEVEAPRDFMGACSAAGKLLRDEFGGKSEALIDFMRWAWRRERDFERRRKASDSESGRRVTWQLQFASRHLLTDYRISMSRARR